MDQETQAQDITLVLGDGSTVTSQQLHASLEAATVLVDGATVPLREFMAKYAPVMVAEVSVAGNTMTEFTRHIVAHATHQRAQALSKLEHVAHGINLAWIRRGVENAPIEAFKEAVKFLDAAALFAAPEAKSVPDATN
jgi:hypothetical protein